jgi:hypothetical protein
MMKTRNAFCVRLRDGLRNPTHAFATGVSCESREGLRVISRIGLLVGIRSEPEYYPPSIYTTINAISRTTVVVVSTVVEEHSGPSASEGMTFSPTKLLTSRGVSPNRTYLGC